MARPRASQAGRRRSRLAPPGDRYGLLLILLVVTYVLSAFIDSPLYSAIQNLLFIATLALAVRTARVHRRTAHAMVATVVLGSAVAIALNLGLAGSAGKGVAAIWTGLVLLATVVTIVRRILAHPVITLQSIYGAVSAYLLLGLMFAAFYRAIDHLGGLPFFSHGESNTTQTFQYFSFTTLTTLGYGDFTAASNGGRAVAVLEALTGQIFLATLISRLVASFRSPPQPAAESGQAPASRSAGPKSRARARPQARLDRPSPGQQPGTDHAAQRRSALKRRPG